MLGARQIIQGWEEGIQLLNVGSKAKLIIPPHLAYGERARGPIPANSTLIFDVELVEIIDTHDHDHGHKSDTEKNVKKSKIKKKSKKK